MDKMIAASDYRELLAQLKSAERIEELDSLKPLLLAFFPKAAVMLGFDQKNSAHPYDLWEHCLHTALNLPRDLEVLEREAFSLCTRMVSVSFPAGLQAIHSRVFDHCLSLEEAVFGEGLEWLGSEAFAHCTSLRRVVLPDSLKYIRSGAFRNCPELFDLRLPPAWVQEHGVEGILNILSGNRKERGRAINRITERFLEGGELSDCLIPVALERLSQPEYRYNWFDKLSRERNAQGISRLLEHYPDIPAELLETALERAITGGCTEITALLLAHQNRYSLPGGDLPLQL